MLTKRPHGNQVFHEVILDFNRDNLRQQNIGELFSELGFSNAEIKRLLNQHAIKIKDTRITPDRNHFEWYWRDVGTMELLEPNELIKFGTNKVLEIGARRQSWYIRLKWFTQDLIDRGKDIIEDNFLNKIKVRCVK